LLKENGGGIGNVKDDTTPVQEELNTTKELLYEANEELEKVTQGTL